MGARQAGWPARSAATRVAAMADSREHGHRIVGELMVRGRQGVDASVRAEEMLERRRTR